MIEFQEVMCEKQASHTQQKDLQKLPSRNQKFM